MNALQTAQPPCLAEAVERMVRKFAPVKIILFGSWARGEATKDSGLDLLMVLPEGGDKSPRSALESLSAWRKKPVSTGFHELRQGPVLMAAKHQPAEPRHKVDTFVGLKRSSLGSDVYYSSSSRQAVNPSSLFFSSAVNFTSRV